MGRKSKSENKRKTKIIRFLVIEKEFNDFNLRKDSLLKYFPTLSSSNIFRAVAKKIDDKALIMFLLLDVTSSFRTRLIMDFDDMYPNFSDIEDN
ncbi:MAG: hypothetical protein WC656_01170 [Sulfurimonas sp.]